MSLEQPTIKNNSDMIRELFISDTIYKIGIYKNTYSSKRKWFQKLFYKKQNPTNKVGFIEI
jgi:hypothetical protein